MEQQRLIPGYRQVEAFGPDEDYEDCDGEVEEEVAYVTLDLGQVEPTLVPSSSTYRLIGLDTPSPYLQLSGTIFKGQHHKLLGTELIFTEPDDTTDAEKKPLEHVAVTEQRIRFKEVELKHKQDKASEGPQPDIIVVPEKYKQKGKRGTGKQRGAGGSRGKGKARAVEHGNGTHTEVAESAPSANDSLELEYMDVSEN